MPKVKKFLLTVVVCSVIAVVSLFGFVMFQNLCAAIFIKLGWETARAVDLFSAGFVVAFLFYAVLPPLYEEFIFRFLLCKGLKLVKLPNWLVMMIAAIIFTLYHRSWSQVVYQFIMGIFFAWIFLKSNNLFWTILIHFINNAFVVTYTYLAAPNNTIMALTAGNVLLAVSLAGLTTVVVTFLIKKGIPNAKR